MPRRPEATGCGQLCVGSDYTPEELAFFQSMREFQQKNNVKFPTFRDILKVVHAIGYRKVAIPYSVPAPDTLDRRYSPPTE
jgi:hypothetical protein